MKVDIAGRELKVGHRVAYCMAGKSQNMRIGVVEKLSPKTVTLVEKNTWGGDIRRNHSAVCIVEV